MKGKHVLFARRVLRQSCHPSVSIDSAVCHSRRRPEVDNELYRHVSKGPFPKEIICFVACFLGGRGIARTLKLHP